MVRYRTPRKKTTNWKTLLGASALGLVLAAVGVVFLVTLPSAEELAAEDAAREAEAAAQETGEQPAEDGADPVTDGDPLDPAGPRPVTQASTRVGGAFLGVGLILMGVLLPVGAFVIEKTSGKKWNRRAGKKHPFKRKI